MANNIDISGRRDSSDESLDIRLTSGQSSGCAENDPPQPNSEENKKLRAQEMARQIAMNIGYDKDDEFDVRSTRERTAEAVQHQAYDAVRETRMPQRSTPRTSQRSGNGAQRSSSSGQRRTTSQGQRTSNGQRRPASSASRSGQRPSTRPQSAQQRKRRKKKSSGGKTATFFLLGFFILLLGMAYFIGLVLTNGKFLPNTTINGIDVSSMSLQEATQTVDNSSTYCTLVVTNEDTTLYTLNLDEFGYSYNIDEQVQKLYSGINRKFWFTSLFKTTDYSLGSALNYDEEKLEKRLRSIQWATTEPQNAFITNTANGYQIVDAVDGSEADAEGIVTHILGEVRKGKLKVNISDYFSVKKAEIQGEDLQDKLSYYEKFKDFTITIDFDYAQETLSMDDYLTWLTFDSDGTYSVNQDEVLHYVSYLSDKYDTYGTTRSFHATIQGDIRVPQGPQGTYGWMIDKEKTAEKLNDLLIAGQSETIDPVYATRIGYDGTVFFTYKGEEDARSENDDIGDTYIEVDLSAQKMWYYENGTCKFTTDQIVSGLASEPSRKTPAGVYEILERKSPDYLSGDGYSNVYVKYFIRVSYEGIGFHDLSRRSYGGNTYLTSGSHGCINMKLAEVEQLYGMVAKGTPVVMYY